MVCFILFGMADENYQNSQVDYLGAISSHGYCLNYLSETDITRNLQDTTLYDNLHLESSSLYDSLENQIGQSKFPPTHDEDIIPDDEYLSSSQLLVSSPISSPTNSETFQYPCPIATFKCTRRSIAEVRVCRIINLPMDIRIYGYTPNKAKLELNNWALNLHTGGGRFTLIWSSSYQTTSKKGRQKSLSCYRARKSKIIGETRKTISQKCNCPYSVRIEECMEGWVINSGCFQHNHGLVESEGVSLAQANSRRIFFPWTRITTCRAIFFKD